MAYIGGWACHSPVRAVLLKYGPAPALYQLLGHAAVRSSFIRQLVEKHNHLAQAALLQLFLSVLAIKAHMH